MVHAFGVKPTPEFSWDLDLFAYKFSEANLKREAQHKSGKITLSGPQQFSVELFFILKSNLVLFLGSILCAYLSLSTFYLLV